VSEAGKFITPELHDMYPFLNADELKAVADSAIRIRAETYGKS
jgi:hypothetical protein